MSIRISLVEDDEPARRSLAVLFNGTPGFRCVSSHRTAEDALKKLPLEECDVVLMDLSLPGASGIECTRELKRRRSAVQVLVLTVHEDAGKIIECLKAGATGYLLKNTPMAQLVEAVQGIHAGGSPMSPAIARKVTEHFAESSSPPKGAARLTDREREVLDLIARGRKNAAIADDLGISAHTVDKHIRHIYEKLQVQTRAEATAKYLAQ